MQEAHPSKLEKGVIFKIVIIILGILVFSGLVCASFLFSRKVHLPTQPVMEPPSPSPTNQFQLEPSEDWEVYRNEEYGYEVKYPGLLKEISTSSDGHYIKFYYKNHDLAFNKYPIIIESIRIYELPTGVNFNEILDYYRRQSFTNELCPGCFNYFWQEAIVVDNHPAILAEVVSHPIGHTINVEILSDLNIISITGISRFAVGDSEVSELGEDEKEEIKNFFKQILSTFKFLE